MHFTPAQLRAMTVPEFSAALDGLREFNAGDDVVPMTEAELEALCALYPDEV